MIRTLRLLPMLLVAATAVAGCKDGAGSDRAPEIASVTVAGAPTTPLRAGSTVQLVATPINATGAAVSDLRIGWSSSDTTVATVSAAGVVTGVTAGHATITARAADKEGTAAIAVLVAREIGTGGGSVEAARGAATLTVPAGVLTQAIEVTLSAAVTETTPPAMLPRSGWAVGYAGMSWGIAGPTLAVRYASADVPAGLPEASLQLYFYSTQNRAWNVVRGSRVDPSTRTVTGAAGVTGTYSVMSTPVSTVVLSGEVVNGALYTGRTAQLNALAMTAAGDTARGYAPAWTSSDNAVATVDAAGKVTGVAAGNATITAKIGDKTAATTVAVVGRPTASWDHTAEWATYQGDNRHTGAIAATVDPSTFTVGWTQTLGARTLPPVSGGGRIYVTAGSRLRALSPANGSELWSYDLGARDSYDPPAFGNGRVYVGTGGHSNSFLFGVDAASGTLIFRSSYANQWSSWYAPVVEGGHVYKAGGYYGGMYSFDGASGAQRWFANTAQYDEWTPAVHEGRVYAYTEPRLQVANASTGATLFTITDPGFSWNGWSMRVAPTVGDRQNVLATQGGRLISFDLAGQRVGWQVTGGFSGPVTVNGGTLYVIKSGGVEARSEADGSLLWSWAPPEGTVSRTLVATRNVVFASTEHNTYAIDAASRRHTWSHPSGGHLAVTPDGLLLIANPSGKITAIKIR